MERTAPIRRTWVRVSLFVLTFIAALAPAWFASGFVHVGVYRIGEWLGYLTASPPAGGPGAGFGHTFTVSTASGAASFNGYPPAWLVSGATGASLVVLTLPPLLLALLVYHRLTFVGTAVDGHTRCGQCGYILKGLTEPRCPECGRAI